jgi:8-hydroxy-5-deazaflavin:NADPH oxidoreductase
MKTAVIGLGSIGGVVANLLTQGGTDIIVASENLAKAEAFARKIGPRAKAQSVGEALKSADVIVMAVWFDVTKSLVTEYASVLGGKVLVDPSNPIAPDGKGGFKKTIPNDQSSGQIIAGLLPPGTRLVKAFGTLSAKSLETAANRIPDKAALFYATDSKEAGNTVAKLISTAGFEPVSAGGIDQSVKLEVFGDLHEFGKLGKVVTAAEAKRVLEG